MASEVFNLPAPTIKQKTRIDWIRNLSLLVNPGLVSGGAAAYIRDFQITSGSAFGARYQTIILKLASTAQGNPNQRGPDFTDQFESNWSIDLNGHVFQSSNFFSDSDDPYSWTGRTGLDVSVFRGALADLFTETNFTLTLDDGASPSTKSRQGTTEYNRVHYKGNEYDRLYHGSTRIY